MLTRLTNAKDSHSLVKDVTDLSVLVVSDDPAVTKVLVAVLRALNVTWLTVAESHGVPAYDHFDLVMLATKSRIQAALDVADAIRARGQEPGPHIALVGVLPTEEKRRSLDWGRIDAIMLMPITIAGVTAQIELALDRRNRGR